MIETIHPYPIGRGENFRLYRCHNWEEFVESLDLIRNINSLRGVFNTNRIVFRGQANGSWSLSSHWERNYLKHQRAGLWENYNIQRQVGSQKYQAALTDQLERFKKGAIAVLKETRTFNDNQWWALGRHHGLWTPLLDWTTDSHTAAFFACHGLHGGASSSAAVWALPVIDGFQDLQFLFDSCDELFARRQFAQKGLFTLLTSAVFTDVANYLKNIGMANAQYPLLAKIELPSCLGDIVLKKLVESGINEDTLLLNPGIDQKLDSLDAVAAKCNELVVSC